MAKKLKILRGRPGAFELHEREAATSDPIARESIQPHIILERYPAYAIAREKISKGYSFITHEGLHKILLNEAITEEDHRRMIVEGKLAVGDVQRAELEQAKVRAPIAHRKLNIVSETTKMGCYSFNLPAGPPVLGGTCPAAGLGFMFLNSSELRQQQRALSEPRPINVPDFICNGCYAIKNSYGNPSQIVFQSFRYTFVLQWLQQGIFVDVMVLAIEAARKKSRKRLKKLPASLRWTVPHPDFFRIHDSGDFFSPEYVRAWFEVCKRLPSVNFWAPTRMWAMKKGSATVFEKGVPSNLSLRPSALHFGERAPVPPGNLVRRLASGSGSGKRVPAGTWKCPAYEHITKGGGLGPRVTAKGKAKLSKTGQLTEAEGTCARAHGPGSPFHGGSVALDAPEGHGCRACWLNQDTPIFYEEH